MKESQSVAARLPKDLLKWLERTAKDEHRTKSNMIVVILEQERERRQQEEAQ